MEPKIDLKRIAERYGIWFILLLSVGLRFVGITWGLPNGTQLFSLHPDEPIILAAAKQISVFSGHLTPGFYNYGSFYLILLSLVSPGTADMTPETTVMAHLAGRMISVLAGAAIAALVYAILKRTTSFWPALAGGLVAAVSPALVVHSRFQTTDMLAAALIMGALYCLVLLLTDENPGKQLSRILTAGTLCGLAAGTKYTGILAFVAVVAVVFMLKSAPKLKFALLALVTTVAGFLVGTPGAVLDSTKFLQDVKFEMAHTSTGHGLVFANTPSGFIYHIGNLITGMGGLIVFIGFAGIVFGCLRRERWLAPVVIIFLLTYLVIGRAEVKFLRYAIPLMPLVAIGVGYWTHELLQRNNAQTKVGIPLMMLGVAGFGGGGLASTLQLSQWMAGPSPQAQAAEFLRENGAGKVIALPNDPWFYSPTIFPLSAAPRSLPREVRLQSLAESKNPKVIVSEQPWDLNWLEAAKPDFVVLSSFEVDDIERLATEKPEPRAEVRPAIAVMGMLKKDYDMVTLFGSGGPSEHDLMYIRPRIWIWKRR